MQAAEPHDRFIGGSESLLCKWGSRVLLLAPDQETGVGELVETKLPWLSRVVWNFHWCAQ